MTQGFSDEGGDLRQCLRERNAAEKLNKELLEALRQASDAIAEFRRYQFGGESRGSYDGKPERDGLWRAHTVANIAIGKAEKRS